MIYARWSRPHYGAHLAPILAALGDPARVPDSVLVASHRDLVDARRDRALNGMPRVLAQHGIGQSYGLAYPAYPGGQDNDDVGLFLVPNGHAAGRWARAYPRARVRVVGSPILDDLPRRVYGARTVAVSFHWPGRFIPEAGSAFWDFRDAVAALPAADGFRVLGHGHPLARALPTWFGKQRIEFVPAFADVCRRADVYVCDNSSTLYEFASTGRPVVVLDARAYRREADHGLRFWAAADVGVRVDDPAGLADAVALALDDPAPVRRRREQALATVYAAPSGGAQAAAHAIWDWLS